MGMGVEFICTYCDPRSRPAIHARIACVAGGFVGEHARASGEAAKTSGFSLPPTHSPQGISRNSRSRARSPTKPPATQASARNLMLPYLLERSKKRKAESLVMLLTTLVNECVCSIPNECVCSSSDECICSLTAKAEEPNSQNNPAKINNRSIIIVTKFHHWAK